MDLPDVSGISELPRIRSHVIPPSAVGVATCTPRGDDSGVDGQLSPPHSDEAFVLDISESAPSSHVGSVAARWRNAGFPKELNTMSKFKNVFLISSPHAFVLAICRNGWSQTTFATTKKLTIC